jgi:ubiquinone biosynthesis protein
MAATTGALAHEAAPAGVSWIWPRLARINLALWGHLFWWLAVRMGLRRPEEPPPRRLARVLEQLGTTFVKLGQGLSLHRDLLPDDYVAELQRLQDHVQPFDAVLARREVERSFGKPIVELFGSFEAEPFAAGSIAQVHRATMPSGRTVIVKIRRPGIRRMVEEDVRILRWFIRSLLWVLPRARRLRPYELVDELWRNLRREIDFRQEAMNIQRFAEMFRTSPDVCVPGVVDGLYSEWVVVQEMSPGRRIDLPEFAPMGRRLAAALVEAYLHQFFREGLFHGDPHPGNLFVTPDGRLCLHDFGLVGALDRDTRLNLVAFMLAFAQQDADWLLDAFLDLGMLAGQVDRAELRAGLQEVIADYARKPLRDWSFGEAFMRVSRLGHGQNIRLPHHLLVLMRAVFLMESTVRKLDPEFNLLEGLFHRAGAVLQEAEAPAAVPTVDRLKFESLLLARQGPRSVGRLAHELRQAVQDWQWRQQAAPGARDAADSGGRRIAGALVALALYASASWLLVHDAGPRIAGMPLLPVLGFAAAAWLTWLCMREPPRS